MKFDICPVPKPRQTQADRWKKRPPVMRYRAFADEVRLKKVEIPEHAHVTFVIPMPRSWSAKKRVLTAGTPHTQKPDVDNLGKSLLDAVHSDDSHVYDIRLTKCWGHHGAIIVDEMQPQGVHIQVEETP